MKAAMQFGLRGYKRWISPMLPHACRFVPTCSEYALEAVERHGAVARHRGLRSRACCAVIRWRAPGMTRCLLESTASMRCCDSVGSAPMGCCPGIHEPPLLNGKSLCPSIEIPNKSPAARATCCSSWWQRFALILVASSSSPRTSRILRPASQPAQTAKAPEARPPAPWAATATKRAVTRLRRPLTSQLRRN